MGELDDLAAAAEATRTKRRRPADSRDEWPAWIGLGVVAVLVPASLGVIIRGLSFPREQTTVIYQQELRPAVVAPPRYPNSTPATVSRRPMPVDEHAGMVWVQPYYRKDGTLVRGHWRRK